MQQETAGELVISGQKDVLALALGKPEHPGRIRRVGQDITISQYRRRTTSVKEKVDEASVSELRAKIKDVESTFGEKIKALELVIQKLRSGNQKQVNEGHPPPEVQVSPTSQPCPQSGKASCSILKTTLDTSKGEIYQSCQLFCLDLKELVVIDIVRDEIERWFYKKEVKSCHVLLYIRYLFNTLGVQDKFKFLCLNQNSPHDQSFEQRAAYIANAMEGDIKGQLFFAPYYFSHHWVLIVMSPQLGSAYWIDPQGQIIQPDVEKLVALSYKLKYFKLGKKTPRKETLWNVVKCPRQSTQTDCGYYVLKFMRDIIHRGSCIIPLKWFSGKSTYQNKDIDEIQREWLDNLFTLIMN